LKVQKKQKMRILCHPGIGQKIRLSIQVQKLKNSIQKCKTCRSALLHPKPGICQQMPFCYGGQYDEAL